MVISEVLMDFTGVSNTKKTAQFSSDGNTYECSVSVNPWNGDVLFSLFLDKEPVVLNRVCLVGEKLINSFGKNDYWDSMKCEMLFVPVIDNNKIGRKLDYRDLGTKVKLLYAWLGDEEDES